MVAIEYLRRACPSTSETQSAGEKSPVVLGIDQIIFCDIFL